MILADFNQVSDFLVINHSPLIFIFSEEIINIITNIY